MNNPLSEYEGNPIPENKEGTQKPPDEKMGLRDRIADTWVSRFMADMGFAAQDAVKAFLPVEFGEGLKGWQPKGFSAPPIFSAAVDTDLSVFVQDAMNYLNNIDADEDEGAQIWQAMHENNPMLMGMIDAFRTASGSTALSEKVAGGESTEGRDDFAEAWSEHPGEQLLNILPAIKQVARTSKMTKTLKALETFEDYTEGIGGTAAGAGVKFASKRLARDPDLYNPEVTSEYGETSTGEPRTTQKSVAQLADEIGAGADQTPAAALTTSHFAGHVEEVGRNIEKGGKMQGRFDDTAAAIKATQDQMLEEMSTKSIDAPDNLKNPEVAGNQLLTDYQATMQGEKAGVGKKLDENKVVMQQSIRSIGLDETGRADTPKYKIDPVQEVAHVPPKYTRTKIEINGENKSGYLVSEGVPANLRGLKIVLVKDGNRWKAYEQTKGVSITPSSWAGGLSNKTREGLLGIVSSFLENRSDTGWGYVADQLDYDLEGLTRIAPEVQGNTLTPETFNNEIFPNTAAEIERLITEDSGVRGNLNDKQLATIIGDVESLFEGLKQKSEAGGITLQDVKQLRTAFHRNMDAFKNANQITEVGSGSAVDLFKRTLFKDLYDLIEKEIDANPADFPENFDAAVKLANMEYAELLKLDQTEAGKHLRRNQNKPVAILDNLLSGNKIVTSEFIADMKKLVGEDGWARAQPGLLNRIFEKSLARATKENPITEKGLKNALDTITKNDPNRLIELFGEETAKTLVEMANFSQMTFEKKGKWNTPYARYVTALFESPRFFDIAASVSFMGPEMAQAIGAIAQKSGYNIGDIGAFQVILAGGIWMGTKTQRWALMSDLGRKWMLEGYSLKKTVMGKENRY